MTRQKADLLRGIREAGGWGDTDVVLGRRLATESLTMPRAQSMEIDRTRRELVYNTTASQDASEAGLLDAFIRLSETPDAEILQFARRYGVLSVSAFAEPGPWAESLDGWREIIGRARTTLEVGAALWDGRQIGSERWEPLRPWWADRERLPLQARLIARFEDVLNAWLLWADVRTVVVLRRSTTGPTPTFYHSNCHGPFGATLTMSGALALQIVAAATLSGKLVNCSACGRTYAAARRPAEGRRNYCDLPDCRREAWRYAKARERTGATKARAQRAKRSASGRRK